MAVIVLKEKLTAWRKIGIVLIIAGAFIAPARSSPRCSPSRS
jgi:drug/metabolite transporter (DMT)-like permease